MEGLSKEYMINQIKSHKDLIKDATDRLSDLIFESRQRMVNMKLTERDSLAVRKTLHEIASELSQIGGYCDKWTKEYIEQTINLIGARTMRQMTYVDVLLLDWWAVRINGIIVDYTKTPFRLSQLKHFLDVISKGLDKIPSRK